MNRIILIYVALLAVLVFCHDTAVCFAGMCVAIGSLFLVDDKGLNKSERKLKRLLDSWFN